jgi:hypothetical protein
MRKGSVWWHAMSLAGTGNRQRRWIDQVSSVISVKPLAAILGERASGLSATYRPTQSRLGRRLQGMASGSSSFFIARGGILRIPDTFGPRLRGLLRVSTGLKSKYQNQHRQDDASPQIDSYQCCTFKIHTHGLLNATTYRATAQRFLRMCGVY